MLIIPFTNARYVYSIDKFISFTTKTLQYKFIVRKISYHIIITLIMIKQSPSYQMYCLLRNLKNKASRVDTTLKKQRSPKDHKQHAMRILSTLGLLYKSNLMPNIWIVLLALIEIGLFCPPVVLNHQIVADFMKLLPSTATQANFAYAFPSPFQQVPQVAVGISSLSISGRASTSSFSAFVVVYASSTALQVRSSPQHSLWNIHQITIIASIHPELLLDTVSARKSTNSIEILSKLAVPSQQELVFKLNLPNTLISYHNLIVRTYLAGLSTNSPLSFLQLANSTLNGDHLTVICSTKEIFSAQLWVSMVALPLQSSSFAVYGGIATIQTIGIRYQDLFKMFAAPQRQFFGINAFSLSPQATFQNTQITASIDSNFILEMEMRGQPSSFQLSYLFLGVVADQICSACAASGQGSIYSDGQCVQQCPPFRVKVSFGSGEVCRVCPSSMGLGFQNGGCIPCGNGMVARNGICISNSTNPQLTQSQINQIFQPQVHNPSVVEISSEDAYGGSIYVPSYSSRCPLPFMYFNGEECLCMVGYTLISSICIKIPIDGTIITPIQIINNSSNPTNNSNQTNSSGNPQIISQCSGPYAYYNGEQCVCNLGYFMVNGNCTYCPVNSQWNGQFCSCNSGYYLHNGNCIHTQIANCPYNSVNNGLGVCVCTQPNYQLINSTCQPILCPSPKAWNGLACTCPDGFITQTDGACQPRCSNGALFLPNNQTCLVVCGVNSIFDATQQQCRCIPGFGIGSGRTCQQCTTNYYQLNGYCVTCPTNSFQSAQGLCQCFQGYAPNFDGTCKPKCGSLEEYNESTTQCDCRRGLARINGVCNVCPMGTFLVGQTCSNCPANALFIDGRCLCNSGFIFNPQSQSCVTCMSLANTFMVNGFCAICPGDQVYNSQTGQCSCPTGLRLQGSRCTQSCQGDQMLGASNLCYSCPGNMVFSNGQCSCMQGYVLSNSGCSCILRCQSNQFAYMGRCAQCPLGMVYSSLITGCVCPEGFYWSSIFNICQKAPNNPASCLLGQYFQNNTQTCQGCPQYCYTCTSSRCIQCISGYQMSNIGLCLPFCGDGVIVATQQCDTGSTNSLGCVNCATTQGYTCTGQPSICTAAVPAQPSPVVANNSLSLQGNVSVNTNNVYITLKTTPTFSFSNQNQMLQFIQASFPNSYKPAVYCMQRLSPNLDLFDCLLIYPSGVPNGKFIINFSYNYQGRSASAIVTVDSLASVLTAQNRIRTGF